MSNRTLKVVAVIALIVIGAYAIAAVSNARRTDKHLTELALEDPGKVMDAMAELRSRGAGIGPRLAEKVQAGDPIASPRAAWLLGMVGSDAGNQQLIAALSSDDQALRVAAMNALGQLQATEAQAQIASLMEDPEGNPEVRCSAATALGLLATPEAVQALVRVLQDRPKPVAAAEPPAAAPDDEAAAKPADEPEPPPDESLPVRVAAANALRTTRQQAATEALAAVFQADVEPAAEVRVAAAYALADLGAAAEEENVAVALDALLRALKDEVGDVRVAAAHGLSMVRVPRDRESEVAAALDTAKSDDHYWTRAAAVDSLSRAGLAH